MVDNDEWINGFKAGYEWCRDLSQMPPGTEVPFWPWQQGTYRNGFAEGTISGRHKFNVSWRWIYAGDPLKGNIVARSYNESSGH